MEEPAFFSQLFTIIHLLLPGFFRKLVQFGVLFFTITVIIRIVVAFIIMDDRLRMAGAVTFCIRVIICVRMSFCTGYGIHAVGLVQIPVIAGDIHIIAAWVFIILSPPRKLSTIVVRPVVISADIRCLICRMI